ncbi:hypothetical protein [Dactylosporangium sp. CS-033363]|uniref:hypothetical protein n=1 Tax=Dactylosporangium sp. CS-033363 TaxID=3239935 RepID=UPI003D90A37E
MTTGALVAEAADGRLQAGPQTLNGRAVTATLPSDAAGERLPADSQGAARSAADARVPQ